MLLGGQMSMTTNMITDFTRLLRCHSKLLRFLQLASIRIAKRSNLWQYSCLHIAVKDMMAFMLDEMSDHYIDSGRMLKAYALDSQEDQTAFCGRPEAAHSAASTAASDQAYG